MRSVPGLHVCVVNVIVISFHMHEKVIVSVKVQERSTLHIALVYLRITSLPSNALLT